MSKNDLFIKGYREGYISGLRDALYRYNDSAQTVQNTVNDMLKNTEQAQIDAKNKERTDD